MLQLPYSQTKQREKKTAAKTIIVSIYCFISICLISVSFLSDLSRNPNTFYTLLSISCVVETLVFFISSYKLSKRVLSFSNIFFLCLLLFNFGQVILLGFFPAAASELTIVLNYFSFDECKYALQIMHAAFAVIGFGILLVSGRLASNKKDRYSSVDENEVLSNKYKDLVLLVLFVLLPIKFYIDLRSVYLTLAVSFDYSKQWYYSISDAIVTLSNISQICVAALIILYNKKPKVQTRLFLISVLYLLIIMLSGRRSESVAFLLVLAYIYFCSRGTKIKPFKLIVYALLAYVLLAFLYSIVYMRNQSGNLISIFVEKFSYSLTRGNILFQALREYGNTGYTCVCVLTKWLPQYAPSFGKSYYYGITAIFPNITGISGELTRESVFGEAMQRAGTLSGHYLNIGGSLLGEAFFNFGVFGGLIALFIVGLLIGHISKHMDIIIAKKRIDYKSFVYISLMVATLYWIRSYFSSNIRDVVWTFAVFWIICQSIGYRYAGERVNYVKKSISQNQTDYK